jgi:hypothetical protein
MAKQVKNTGRQYGLDGLIVASVALASIGAGNEIITKLPPGAWVTNVVSNVTTAFDGSGTVTATLTDGTTVFINAITAKATGALATAVTNKYFPNGGTLTFSIADQNSNSTVGQVLIDVQYKVVGRANEAYTE